MASARLVARPAPSFIFEKIRAPRDQIHLLRTNDIKCQSNFANNIQPRY